MLTKHQIIEALRGVSDPELERDIVSLNLLKEVREVDGIVTLELKLPSIKCPQKFGIEEGAKKAVMRIDGVKEVRLKISPLVVVTTRKESDLLLGQKLSGVKNVIAVSSGKGGVGKSIVAANLAVTLANSGNKVGILDADVYGANVPLLLGLKIKQVTGFFLRQSSEERITPLDFNGLKVASLGSFYSDDTPLMWRGAWVSGAINMLLTDVDWGELDYLVCDLPPGTGDASLTIAKSVPLGGAVVVTTPEEGSRTIAGKALYMFRKLRIPILGIVENMSYFHCPHCNERTYPFSKGGGRLLASSTGVNFLGEIPLDPNLAEKNSVGAKRRPLASDSAGEKAVKDIAFRALIALSQLA
jgi:ATP-binding protein involved in chromosome partitioning